MKNGEDITKTISKEKLLQIVDLNSEKIEQMTDVQLQNYTKALSTAANLFPIHKEKLEGAFREMDYAPMLQWLKAIKNSLSKIHADNLASDCERQIELNQDLNNIRHEKLRTFLDYFLSTSTMLFSDILTIQEELEIESFELRYKQEAGLERIREKLLTVTELNPNKVENMTDEQLYGFIEALTAFQEHFPSQEIGLRDALKSKNYTFVLKWLVAIEETLEKIHADSLAETCRNQININKNLANIRHERLEAYISYFLKSLSLLSDDIKMLNLPKRETNEPSDNVETEAGVEVITPGVSSSSKTILAVNKTRFFLENLKVALDGSGRKLVGATQSRSALEYLKTDKPDLFILDDDLPEIKGYAFARKIREMGHTAPIIFLTGDITKEYMVKAMSWGVADFIIKPIDTKNVREKVAKHMK
ncbi:MAG: response regulator [Defluviitaleaceae bacterium]|nr:response regulator [Defluviitaleaceae bacterium]